MSNALASSLFALSLLALGDSALSRSADPMVTEGVVNASVEEVWRAWTTKEGIESWMVAKTEFELKVGALWRTSYSKDSNLNDDASIHQTILAFDPGRMLSFRTVKPPKGFPWPNAIAQTWVVVYFEAVEPKKTKVTIKMLGFTDDKESQEMRPKFEAGNKWTLDQLVKKFASSGTR